MHPPSPATAHITTDHEVIRHWVEERCGRPAIVKSAAHDRVASMRIEFPGYAGKGHLEEITWDDFFRRFEQAKLAFVYRETTDDGERSNFNKLVSREHRSAGASERPIGLGPVTWPH